MEARGLPTLSARLSEARYQRAQALPLQYEAMEHVMATVKTYLLQAKVLRKPAAEMVAAQARVKADSIQRRDVRETFLKIAIS